MMPVYACGLNTSSQIVKEGPGVICCPTLVTWATDITQARATFTRIFWHTGNGWKCTGFKQENVPDEAAIGGDIEIYASDNRIVAVNSDGSLLTWEKRWRTLHFQHCQEELELDDQKALQHSADTEEEDSEKPEKLMKVSSDSESVKREEVDNCHHSPNCSLSFSQVALEDTALLALSSDGVVFSGGVAVPLRTKVKEVAVGKEHCMALSQDGEVYTWGSGMRGQLGVGELCNSEKPLVVESLQGIIISSITCGAWHCLAQSECEDVYVWGWNESGQLGFPQRSQNNHTIFTSFQHTCQCPRSQKSIKPQSKIDGQHLSCDVSGNGESKDVAEGISAKQDDNSADLRINSHRSREVVNVQASPKLLDFWAEDVNVVSIECGDRHTLFLLEDGSAWAVGMNRYGQLGLGHTRPSEEPCEVLKGVVRIFVGGWNTVFLTSSPHL